MVRSNPRNVTTSRSKCPWLLMSDNVPVRPINLEQFTFPIHGARVVLAYTRAQTVARACALRDPVTGSSRNVSQTRRDFAWRTRFASYRFASLFFSCHLLSHPKLSRDPHAVSLDRAPPRRVSWIGAWWRETRNEAPHRPHSDTRDRFEHDTRQWSRLLAHLETVHAIFAPTAICLRARASASHPTLADLDTPLSTGYPGRRISRSIQAVSVRRTSFYGRC